MVPNAPRKKKPVKDVVTRFNIRPMKAPRFAEATTTAPSPSTPPRPAAVTTSEAPRKKRFADVVGMFKIEAARRPVFEVRSETSTVSPPRASFNMAATMERVKGEVVRRITVPWQKRQAAGRGASALAAARLRG
jgi:hypothetical protein